MKFRPRSAHLHSHIFHENHERSAIRPLSQNLVANHVGGVGGFSELLSLDPDPEHHVLFGKKPDMAFSTDFTQKSAFFLQI